MYCVKCGHENNDNNYRCERCGEVLHRAGENAHTSGISPAPSGLATAIIVTILCCWPLGIPAIVFAAQTMGHNSAGRYAEAKVTSDRAKMWSWIAFGAGLLVLVPYMIFSVIVGASASP